MSEADIPHAVAEAGGFGFVAHPWSKGARILERYGRWVKRGRPSRLAGPRLRHRRRNRALEPHHRRVRGLARARWTRSATCATPRRSSTGRAPRTSSAWDRICEKRRFVAIGGLDAHQHGIRVRGRLWSPMRNARYFAILSTYVCLDRGAAGRRARRRPTSSSSTTRCARGAATSRSTRSHPAAASASGASPAGAHAMMGEEHPAGDVDPSRLAAGGRHGSSLLRNGEPDRRGRRARPWSTRSPSRAPTGSKPTATGESASAHGSTQTRSTSADGVRPLTLCS